VFRDPDTLVGEKSSCFVIHDFQKPFGHNISGRNRASEALGHKISGRNRASDSSDTRFRPEILRQGRPRTQDFRPKSCVPRRSLETPKVFHTRAAEDVKHELFSPIVSRVRTQDFGPKSCVPSSHWRVEAARAMAVSQRRPHFQGNACLGHSGSPRPAQST
jgi:hypothetical protein